MRVFEELFKKNDVVNVIVKETEQLVRDNPVTVDRVIWQTMHAVDSAGHERLFHRKHFLFENISGVCA